MNIPITDTFRLSTDAYNFIIQEEVTVKSGKTKGEKHWVSHGYYNTIDNAMRGLCRRFMLDSEANSLDELKTLISKLSGLVEDVRGAIENVSKG